MQDLAEVIRGTLSWTGQPFESRETSPGGGEIGSRRIPGTLLSLRMELGPLAHGWPGNGGLGPVAAGNEV